jgi:hypothetical protein
MLSDDKFLRITMAKRVRCLSIPPGLPDGYIFSNQKSRLSKFWSVLQLKQLVHFMALWSILQPFPYLLWLFGIFCGHFGTFFQCWYVVPRTIWQPCNPLSVSLQAAICKCRTRQLGQEIGLGVLVTRWENYYRIQWAESPQSGGQYLGHTYLGLFLGKKSIDNLCFLYWVSFGEYIYHRMKIPKLTAKQYINTERTFFEIFRAWWNIFRKWFWRKCSMVGETFNTQVHMY